MSHSANTVSSHRLHPIERAERLPAWELHLGMTGFLYIVGPGPNAMQRVAREETLINLSVAAKAVHLLNQTKREDVDAGPADILDALRACGWDEDDF